MCTLGQWAYTAATSTDYAYTVRALGRLHLLTGLAPCSGQGWQCYTTLTALHLPCVLQYPSFSSGRACVCPQCLSVLAQSAKKAGNAAKGNPTYNIRRRMSATGCYIRPVINACFWLCGRCCCSRLDRLSLRACLQPCAVPRSPPQLSHLRCV